MSPKNYEETGDGFRSGCANHVELMQFHILEEVG